MRLVRRKNRRPEPVEKLQLEQVIGLTSTSANGLACNPSTGDIAYLAGCVVVVFNTVKKMQTKFLMVLRTPKPLACVTYSPHGGKLIAAGECGHQPATLIWDALDGSCIAELKAHKYGISCVRFSPNGKYILSVGFPHDGQICIFDYKTGMLIHKLKATTASSPIEEIQFASDGSFFVAAGINQLNNWTIGLHPGRSKPNQGAVLECRNINLGSLTECSFVAVASLEDVKDIGGTKEIQPIYALSSAGILCMLHRGLAVKKWVNLKVRKAHSLSISQCHIACACSDGTVRVFMTETLAYGTTLPRPAPLGFHDLTDDNTASYFATNDVDGIVYPDAVACRFATPAVLAVLYMDHSLFIWDVQDFSKVVKLHSVLPHSGCIWDIVNVPSDMDKVSISTCDSISATGENDLMGTFATCSSDGSIRLWSICSQFDPDDGESPRNVYDQNICGVLYQERQSKSEAKPRTPHNAESVDTCKGFRSISTSPDGRYLAAGDRSGNLYIYDLHSLQIITHKEAHDAEILTLSFGTVEVVNGDTQNRKDLLLASGGRDRLVHIYDASRNFEVIETRDDHSASVTAARFACNGSKLLSSSADKSVVFRSIEVSTVGFKSTRYHQEMASRGTVYDMDIDPSRKVAVTVSQDKKINFLSLETGKSLKSIKPDGELGEPIKVRVDPTGTLLVCSHSDKVLRIYDMSSGDLLSSGQGHAEVITGVVFTRDCKRLVSVSGDSCIFIWKLPNYLTKMIRKRCILDSESSRLLLSNRSAEPFEKQEQTPKIMDGKLVPDDDAHMHESGNELILTDAMCNIPSAFTFSVSRLPHWAQAKVSGTIVRKSMDTLEEGSIHSSESRWAERLGSEGYKLFCEPQMLTPPATVVPSKLGLRRRFTVEPGGSCTFIHDTPECSTGSYFNETPTPSTTVSTRKEDNWNTVHTLFFDEADSVAESSRQLFSQHTKGNNNWHLNHERTEKGTLKTCSKEDCTVIYKADNDQEVLASSPRAESFYKEPSRFLCQTPIPLACMVNSRNDRSMSIYFRSTVEDDCGNQAKSLIDTMGNDELNGDIHGVQQVHSYNEETSDDESEQHFSIDGGMFDAHFSNLSTVLKAGHISTRSSFSARFFSQSNHTLPVLSLFQESSEVNSKLIIDTRDTCSEIVTVDSQEQQLPCLEPVIDATNSNFTAEEISTDDTDELEMHETHDEKQPQYSTMMAAPIVEEVSAEDKDGLILQHFQKDKQGLVPTAKTVREFVINDRSDDPSTVDSSHQVPESTLFSMSCESIALSQSCGMQSSTLALCSSSEGLMQESESPKDTKQGLNVNGQTQNTAPTQLEVVSDFAVESRSSNGKPVDLLKKALQDLSHAADNVCTTFQDLALSKEVEVLFLHEEFVYPTLQKLWQLSDMMSSNQTSCNASAPDNQPSVECGRTSWSDHSALRISNTGSRSYSTPSIPESVDIEGLVQTYSARYSEMLASQVLALVEKGLNSKQ